jgi:hypothetical protein
MFYLIPTVNINDVVRVIYYVNSINSFHNQNLKSLLNLPLLKNILYGER